MTAPTVLLADDHGAIRAGLRIMLEAQGITVVGEAADGDVAVRNAAALRPDVVLMDLRMPGRDGISATREIVERGLGDVLVLTSFDEDDLVFGAIRAGAVGFLLKTVDAPALAEAVRAVAAGEGALDPRVTRRALAAVAQSAMPSVPVSSRGGFLRPDGAGAGGARRDTAGVVQRPARREAAHLGAHGQDACLERAHQTRSAQPLARRGPRAGSRGLNVSPVTPS